MRRLLTTTATISVLLLAAGCGGSSGNADGSAAPSTSLPPSATSAGKPIFPVSNGPTGTDRVTHGPLSIAMPATFEQHGDETKQSKSTTVTFVSTRKEGSQRAAIGVTWSTKPHAKSAKQEARAFRGELLDVNHVKDLQMVRVDWPGLKSAYQFEYTDHDVSPAMHSLVLMGDTAGGQFVSVTAKAPPALVEQLEVEQICGSLRVRGETDGT